MRLLVLIIAGASFALPVEDSSDTDGEQSRKILGSSVVTSVSVIMDTGNGSKTVYTDAVGKPVPKPLSASELASPIDLLNPDRYEFYTFDDNGDLIKRLMSLEEIQGIIATGDSDGYDLDSFTSLGYLPEKRVNDVVNNVQNVLKEKIETHKEPPNSKPIFDTPDVSDSWSMILPAVFGNSGDDIKPERPITHVTPDTIMVEPNMENSYLTTAKNNNVITTSSSFVTSASTPRSTSYSQTPNKIPTDYSTSAQMSTTEKLVTLNSQSTTNTIPILTPVTEAEQKPLINVEIYSNSKSTTEKPLDQMEVENSSTVEIKPTTDVPKIATNPPFTTKRPLTTVQTEISSQSPIQTDVKLTSNVIENTTMPATLMSFIPSSMGSTLPTTKTPTKLSTQQPTSTASSTVDFTQTASTTNIPTLTKYTTETLISTWRPEPDRIIISESQIVTEEVPLSTWIPDVSTNKEMQSSSKEDNLPTHLSEILNLNKTDNITSSKGVATTISPQTDERESSTISSTANDDQNKKEPSTTEYVIQETVQPNADEKQQSTERYIQEDLSTLGSELFTTKLNEKVISETTTQLSLEQSLNSDQKVSASELLDQLLFTTNIYEINTELGEKTSEQQIYSNDDERFETNTQQEPNTTEEKTELPTTTEEFLIKVTEKNEEPTTDKTLIDSIEQLISQAVGNIEEVITAINDTETIQETLDNSGRKNMSDVQVESATLASSLIDSNINLQEDIETTTTEISILDAITSGDSNVLSDSVGSLLSQIYESNIPSINNNVEILSTESTPTTIFNKKNDADDIILSTSASDKFEAISIKNNDEVTVVPEITTATEDDIVNESTTTVYIPVNTIYTNNTNNSSEDSNFVPHLINITIISSDTNTNIRNSSYKPAKSDVSLEQMLDEEIRKNMTIAESNKIFIDQTVTSNDQLNDKTPNEILNAEETMAALYNSNSTTTNQPFRETSTDLPEVQDNTELLTEDYTFTTTEQSIPVKEIPTLTRKPTTIVIIKRTEKPSTEAFTTSLPLKPDEIIETTTMMDERLESTTYSKFEIETTEFSTEAIPPSTTDISQGDRNTATITEMPKETEPSIDIIITENNKPLSDDQKTEKFNLSLTTSSILVGGNTEESIKEEQSNNKTSNLQSFKKEDNSSNQEGKKPIETVVENTPESTWTLVSTVAPHKEPEKQIHKNKSTPIEQYPEIIDPPTPVDLQPKPLQGFGLEDSTSRLDTDIYQFVQLCNELAFGFWKTVTNGLSSARSVFVSPFGATSLLAMVFLGARGSTSGEMNEILRLDDMVTFNPHLIFKNVSESIKSDEADSGVATSAIIRQLFSDRSKGKLLPFYKERARAFYDGYVEEVSFREIGDVIRRRTNLQVKKYTNGKITEYLKDSSTNARSPLAGVSVNIFQTDCSHVSTEGRDGEIHFVVLPSIRQRRLIPVPAVVYRSGFLAGYEPSLDATAVSLGMKDQIVSTILVIPGQQGISAPGDGLSRLEKRLVESSFKKGAWSRLLRSLIPRPGLEVQIPRFSHKSIINATVALKKMGLHDLFDVEKADLRGLNGVANELFLSDMLQINSFATCGENRIGETHHSEIYPATASRARNSRYLEHFESEENFWRSDLMEEPRDYQRSFPDPLYDPGYLSLPLPLRPRQARLPENPRLKFDRPFLYFVRHNPTGLILHMGRFNPRLLP